MTVPSMMPPNAPLAAAMTAEVNERLLSALTYLITDVIGADLPAAGLSSAPAAHALQALMREAAVGNDPERIKQLYAEHGAVLDKGQERARGRVIVWGSDDMTPSEAALFQAAFSDDIGLTARLTAPGADIVGDFTRCLDLVEHSMRRHVPDWWDETEAFISLILLVQGEEGGAPFGGASSFAGWQAILLNPHLHATPLRLALGLVHECSHLKLFHAYLDDEIVLNDPDERYHSAFRRAPRPMNGLYHAAYVLARMIAFLHDLERSGALSELEQEGDAGSKIESYRAAFADILSLIREHGQLTPNGTTLIDEAADAVARCTDRQAAE